MLAVPIGVAAAIYLEEYGGRSRLRALIEINITNLAGVPSIIYGLLGLGLFVRVMGWAAACSPAPRRWRCWCCRSSSSRRARRCARCPTSLREGSYALGATRWQTIWHQVLPVALPGILTGLILALSRAIGETAPLITIGALTYVPFAPDSHLVAVHGAADPDLQLGVAPAGGLSRQRRRRHPRAARAAADHERRRHLAARPLPEEARA